MYLSIPNILGRYLDLIAVYISSCAIVLVVNIKIFYYNILKCVNVCLY